MLYTDKIIKEINDLFKDDITTREKLLNYDGDTIRELALNNNIKPLEIIDCIEKAKSLDDLDELYNKAIFNQRKKNLYFDIVKLPNKGKIKVKK